MSEIDWYSITREIGDYKSSGRYYECMQKIDQLLQDAKDSTLVVILLTAKASCAMQIGDMETALNISAQIDVSSVTSDIRDYALLTKATVAQESGRPELALALLSDMLNEGNEIADGGREVMYEALARKGFALATLKDFKSALGFLQRAATVDPIGEYRDNIDLYAAYCLQALGKLASAEKHVEELLSRKPPNLEADAYYRLGAIYLQSGALGSAMTAFNCALEHLPGKSVTHVDIINALAEVDKKLASGSIQ